MTENNKKIANDTEFKVGDYVRVKKITSEHVISAGMLGVVVGIIKYEILVKFDNFTDGHNGDPYYRDNNMDHDIDDVSHWYMFPSHLEKVEKSAHEKLLELGYVVSKNISDKKGNIISIEYKKIEAVDEYKTIYNLIKIDLESKMFNAWRIYKDYLKSGFWDSTNHLWIDKKLAEILLQYLGEIK